MRRQLVTIPLLVVILSGCGITITPTEQVAPDDGASGHPLDSDGDGFSDEIELNGFRPTDPFDVTDSPGNIRDADGDGCSDFSEANFTLYCDGDPNSVDSDGDGFLDTSETNVTVSLGR